jgi:hypothetical protein
MKMMKMKMMKMKMMKMKMMKMKMMKMKMMKMKMMKMMKMKMMKMKMMKMKMGPPIIPIAIPIGIDEGAGGAVFPEDPDDPTGPGVAAGLDPDTVDPGFGSEDDAPPPVPAKGSKAAPAPPPPVDAQWQVTRYVTLSNATQTKLKVKLTYETFDERNEVVVDEAEVELDPGEVADIEQDGWRINARRIMIYAQGDDGTELRRFKDRWLDLVPEIAEDGLPGYPSPTIQRATIVLR